MKLLFQLIKFIVNTNFKYNRPKSSKILIFDKKGFGAIEFLLKKKNFSILCVRGEELNFYVIFQLLLNLKKITFSNYIENYIKLVNPVHIINHSVNHKFFMLKKKFPKIKTTYIQSELIHDFEYAKFNKSYKCDYSFVWGKQDEMKFKKYTKNKPELMGSINNNKYKNSIIKNDNKNLYYISQFREGNTKDNTFTLNTGKKVEHSLYYKPDIFLINTLIDYCKIKNKKLSILISARDKNKIKKEKNFYKKNLKEQSYKFISSTTKHYGYKVINKFDKIIFINSTLGFECLARKKKCIFFHIRNKFLKFNYNKLPFKPNGLLWSDSTVPKTLFAKLDILFKINYKEV
ncbi:hypothetical protein OAD54_00430, partial [Candidatus Pelagibacter sp.]|nr:hypothetical protein [Candidatus Pelagibacter sp.]